MRFEHRKSVTGRNADTPVPASRIRRGVLCVATLLPALLVWGCAGVVSGQNSTAPPPPGLTFSITGAISPAATASGTTVTLSGVANATTTVSSSGSFTFANLANGTYTLTPSHAGYSFTPSSLNITVSGANISTGINFTATAQTFGLSGTISPVAGGSGATVTLSGAGSATTTVNSSGNYTFTGLANGIYTVTPSRAGYTFNPTSQNATINGASVSGLNFTATQQVNPTFTISGTISPVAGGNGATVTLSGATAASTTANSSGNYSFTGLSNGVYAVTPSRSGYTFTPISQNATVNGANVTGVNFTATQQVNPTFTISGTISPLAGGSGARVTLSGAGSGTATADGSGNYSFTGLANGTYTVAPTNIGYTFSPVSLSETVNGANIGSVNFTATPVQAHSATLSWTASTSAVTGYNIYRGSVTGGPYTLVNTSLVTLVTFTDSAVQSGATYFYVTTAVDGSGNESVFSNEVKAVIP
jgi:Protein of unknown function (DUF2012)